MCNSVNIYLIISYFISFESKFSALQDSIITKSRAEHPFSSSGHIYLSPFLCKSVLLNVKGPIIMLFKDDFTYVFLPSSITCGIYWAVFITQNGGNKA